jgi:DNA repair protein RadC
MSLEQLALFEEGERLNKTRNYCDSARESLECYAVEQIDLQSVLAVLIGPKATPEMCGSMAALTPKQWMHLTSYELKKQYGLSDKSAKTLYAAICLYKKMAQKREDNNYTIRSSEDVSRLMMPKMRYLEQEHFICLFLDTKNKVMAEQTVFIGTLNSAIVHPRDIYKEAIKRNSASIICLHNHPSGDPQPSQADIEVTKRLIEVGNLVGIDLLDHIIIGDGQYSSLKEKRFI